MDQLIASRWRTGTHFASFGLHPAVLTSRARRRQMSPGTPAGCVR